MDILFGTGPIFGTVPESSWASTCLMWIGLAELSYSVREAGPTPATLGQDQQLFTRLQIDVWISQNSDQDQQLFHLSPEHCSATYLGYIIT